MLKGNPRVFRGEEAVHCFDNERRELLVFSAELQLLSYFGAPESPSGKLGAVTEMKNNQLFIILGLLTNHSTNQSVRAQSGD